MFADGDAEMDLLADLLGNGKTSRLYRTLVYERRIALDVSAFQNSRELGSFFLVVVTAAPGEVNGLTFGGEEHGWDGALSTIVQDPLEQVFVALYDISDDDENGR